MRRSGIGGIDGLLTYLSGVVWLGAAHKVPGLNDSWAGEDRRQKVKEANEEGGVLHFG